MKNERLYQSTLEGCLRTAGEVLMRHYGRPHTIEYKGDVNPVTETDREAERAIINRILAAFPTDRILAEESGDSAREAETCWIIDPLDGTTNYTHTAPYFSVSIGVQRRGEMLLGGVFAPFFGELFLAERDAGATLNGRPIRVSATAPLDLALLCADFSHDRRQNSRYYMKVFERLMNTSQGVLRMGSAALNLCWVACGRADGYWNRGLAAWDTAAGALIVEEAGGRMSDFAGTPYSCHVPQCLASNGRIHDELLAILREFNHSME
jgi:myo-inositol-1(or 4)-monophosphatase